MALLLLEPGPTNTTRSVCLLSYRKDDKSESWHVVRRAIHQSGAVTDAVTDAVPDTVRVTYRMKGTEDDGPWYARKRPRPAARFEFVTENHLAMLLRMGEAPRAVPVGGPPRDPSDGDCAAWYRCGSGCCGSGCCGAGCCGAGLESFH